MKRSLYSPVQVAFARGQVKRAVVEKEKLRTGRSVSRWQDRLWEGASCKTTVEV